MKLRRLFTILWTLSMGLLFINHVQADDPEKGNVRFRFGTIADCQYADIRGEGVRKYALSEQKLKKCVGELNSMDLDYVVNLGDLIDRDFDSYEVIQPILNRLNIPVYNVLGNHDYDVADNRKDEVPEKLNMPSRYYDFEVKGWRFVVLDGNDISFHAYPQNSAQYEKADEYYEQQNIESPEWNGAIGDKQIAWLKKTLKKASGNKEKVVLFCHFPIYPENNHNLWNAKEIVQVIEDYPCVKAYMSGHNHEGNYDMKAGIHYLTFKGMVDTEQNSYAIVNVYKDRLKIQGYGREEDRVMEMK